MKWSGLFFQKDYSGVIRGKKNQLTLLTVLDDAWNPRENWRKLGSKVLWRMTPYIALRTGSPRDGHLRRCCHGMLQTSGHNICQWNGIHTEPLPPFTYFGIQMCAMGEPNSQSPGLTPVPWLPSNQKGWFLTSTLGSGFHNVGNSPSKPGPKVLGCHDRWHLIWQES